MKNMFNKSVIMLAMGIALIACGERYEEPTDASFSGTWVYETVYTYENGKCIDTLKDSKIFLEIRDNMLLYYSNGVYDSSFVYRLEESKESTLVKGTRTNDLTYLATQVKKIKRDSKGVPMLDDKGGFIYEKDDNGNFIYEKVEDYRKAKPSIPASTKGNDEISIAISTFSDGKMHFKCYTDFKNTSDANLIREIVMMRPENK